MISIFQNADCREAQVLPWVYLMQKQRAETGSSGERSSRAQPCCDAAALELVLRFTGPYSFAGLMCCQFKKATELIITVLSRKICTELQQLIFRGNPSLQRITSGICNRNTETFCLFLNTCCLALFLVWNLFFFFLYSI